MSILRSVELFFQEGASDKVYNAQIVEDGGLYTCHVAWGRRGSPLSTGTKAVKVSRAAAEKAFDKLVRDKTSKGYQEVSAQVAPAAVAPPVGQGSASRVAGTGRKRLGQAAQLLNAVEEQGLEALFVDAGVVAQQKLDGVRVIMHVGAEVVGTNRTGQVTSVAQPVLSAVAAAPAGTVLDGELVAGEDGQVYWLFDMLQHSDEDLRALAYVDRYARLSAAMKDLGGPVKVVATARGEADKRALHRKLEAERAEGIVFKRASAPYQPGRPASGGHQLKYKFVKSADVMITANAGNAYQMAVYDGDRIVEVGKVFAGTTNESRRQLDALITGGERPVAEVRYLCATDGDQLFQPVFAQLRDDKEPADCTLDQLVRTNRAVSG